MIRNKIAVSTLTLALSLLILCTSQPSQAAQTFTDIGAGLRGVSECSLAWGDYDGDGDLDLALAGNNYGSNEAKIYRNNGGVFTSIGANIAGVANCSLAWGDYDNDGDLDLALAGNNGYYSPISKIYRNDSGVFVDIGASLIGVDMCSLAWGDYDNDGDLDLALAGGSESGLVSKIYRNNCGVFEDIGAGLQGVSLCSVAWGDYDKDGDLDLALAGQKTGGGAVSKIYRNDSGVFTDIGAGLPDVMYGSLAWGDYDSDGDLDLALAGFSASGPISKIYRNDNEVFTDTGANLIGVGVIGCSLAWGDYDNDGDLDLVLAGSTGSSTSVTKIYRNDNGAFIDIGAGLTDVGTSGCSLAWGDYDNDGDLDLALAGYSITGYGYASKIYRNSGGTLNTSPTAPTGLSASASGGDISFNWNAASDAQTSVSGLSYNIRVGSAPGKDDIFSGMANLSSGLRRIPSIGNTQKGFSWTLKGLNTRIKDCYWSVQAIDSAFAGSAWAAESAIIRPIKITGHIKTPGGTPVQGVVVGANNGGTMQMTDSDGYYEVYVPMSWSGTVTPSKSLYYLDPENMQYTDVITDQPGRDFTANPYPTISGYVRTQAGSAIPGVTLTTNDGSVSAITDINGYYKLQVRPGWNGTITPNKNMCTFDPRSKTYPNVISDQPEQNFISVGGFTDIGAELTGVSSCSLSWGDYDNDGDFDLAISGYTGGSYVSRIYRNNMGNFVDIGAGLDGGRSIAWGDYDNDGDLDIALSGYNGSAYISKIYRNNNGAFMDIGAGLTGASGSLAWGDYDNDGDLDLVLAGTNSSGAISKIYRNNNGVFTDIGAGLADVWYCSVAWGDYDNDGDLDLALAGHSSTSAIISKIYRNNNGIFTDIGSKLIGVYRGSLAWGDYDNDGDLDLALTGDNENAYFSIIYQNNDGVFTDAGAGLPGVCLGSLAWGDYDNDGSLDLALAGLSRNGFEGKIYRNNNGRFADIGVPLLGLLDCFLAWGDYNNDGGLDLVLAGNYYDFTSGKYMFSSRIYRNDFGVSDTAPDSPAGLFATSFGNEVTFCWDAASDAQTPESGLAYNLRVGTAPGKDDVFSSMSDLFSGYRRLPSIGNAQKNLSWTLKGLDSSKVYYWSVQAIDTAFAGSEWAAEEVLSPYAISGKVVLGNYEGDCTKVPVTVELRKQGGSATSRSINLGADGSFTLGNIEQGTYDITFKASHWLSKTVRGVVVQ